MERNLPEEVSTLKEPKQGWCRKDAKQDWQARIDRVVLHVRNTEHDMTVSARLSPRMQIALARYCKSHGLTKTEALERGIDLLLASEGGGKRHRAFEAYERLRPQLTGHSDAKSRLDSTESPKRHLDEKYPG